MINVRRKCNDRRGIAAVEAAVTLPLMMLVVFSMIQLNHYMHVQTCLKIAGSEAALAFGSPDGTYDDGAKVFYEHCRALGIKGAHYANHANSGGKETGALCEVVPSASYSANKLPLPAPLILPVRNGNIESESILYLRESK